MPTDSEFLGYPEGYAAGEGGAVTQLTSRTTTVVLNALNGAITLFAATLAADTTVSFTCTNNKIAVNDHLIFNVIGGAAVRAAYLIDCIPAAGSMQVDVHNVTPTITASESPVISFAVIKGSVS